MYFYFNICHIMFSGLMLNKICVSYDFSTSYSFISDDAYCTRTSLITRFRLKLKFNIN